MNEEKKYDIIIPMIGKRILFFLCACLFLITTQLSALNPDKPLDQYQLKEWGVSDGLPSDTVGAIIQTPDGYLWIGTPNGLVRFDGVTFKVFSTKTHPGIIDNAVHTLFVNKEGVLRIGTEKGSMVYQNGIFKQVSGGFEDGEGNQLGKTEKTGRISIGSVYKNKEIICFFEDREKNLWLGTNASGLLRLRDVPFKTYSTREGLPDIIISLYEDPQGVIWIGAVHKGLYIFKDNVITKFSTPNKELNNALTDNLISAMAADHKGDFWVGTDGGGLLRLKGDDFTAFTTEDGLVSNDVKNLFFDNRDNLWICTGDGLTLYLMDTGTFTTPAKWENIGHAGGFALLDSDNGDIWLGTPYGILVFENKGGTIAHKEIHLRGTGVTAIHRENSPDGDENGDILWIGTVGSGLKRFKDGTFTSCTVENGLGSDVIYQILPDEREYFWMNSFNGVFRARKSQLVDCMEGRIEKIECRVFGIEHGLNSTGCNLAAIRTRTGKLWFSTYRGIAVVDPGEIKIKTDSPPTLNVLIEQVAVDGKVVEPGDIRDGMIFYDVEKIVFHFTVPYFAAPGKIRFKYKLDGFDNEWVYHGFGKERTAVYTNLPPGSYRFNVAAGGGGNWNPTSASTAFSLKANFFKSVAFLLITAIFVLLLIIIILILIRRKK